MGASIEVTHGVDQRTQQRQVLSLALVHGINPRDYYRFGLFRPERRAAMWDYVYPCETAAYHHHERRNAANQARHLELLADKAYFAAIARDRNLPVVGVDSVMAKGSTWRDLPETADERICKPRRGSGGRGVFRYALENGQLHVSSLHGTPVDAAEGRRLVDRALAAEDHVLQRYHAGSPVLTDRATPCTEAITLRLITRQPDSEGGPAGVWCAFLEIPTLEGRYASIEVDPESGTVRGKLSEANAPGNAGQAPAAPTMLTNWPSAVDTVTRAHRLVDGLPSVAWDLIPTGDDYLLLEGNAGWAVVAPQMIVGPLLQEA